MRPWPPLMVTVPLPVAPSVKAWLNVKGVPPATAGVPMVCTPMGRDQYAVSWCVERLGLGRVASMTASPEELRQVLVAALADDALQARARTFAAGLDVEAGLARALEVLETLQVPRA